MNDINRIMILILLIGLLYALYTYQKKQDNPTPDIKKKTIVEKKVIESTEVDDCSLGSLMDINSDFDTTNNEQKSDDSFE